MQKLEKAPIVEAVLDLDCDFTAGWDLGALEIGAREAFKDHYPKHATRVLQEHKIEAPLQKAPKVWVRQGLDALQFLQADERQLVQVRRSGFSFNRLAPYTTLDDYLPEIERAWSVFLKIALPTQVRLIRLRYINRILIPLKDGAVDLDQYFANGPKLPGEESLFLGAFLHRHSLVEKRTGHRAQTTLASEPPSDKELPIILDIETGAEVRLDPQEWPAILSGIQELRELKNLVFERSLTPGCLSLF